MSKPKRERLMIRDPAAIAAAASPIAPVDRSRAPTIQNTRPKTLVKAEFSIMVIEFR